LTFSLRTIDPDSKTLHGSLTLSDIAHRLEEDFDLSQADVAVAWRSGVEGDRLKTLGRARVKVQVRDGGREERVIGVIVVRLADQVET
jgi:hypothetical protein